MFGIARSFFLLSKDGIQIVWDVVVFLRNLSLSQVHH